MSNYTEMNVGLTSLVGISGKARSGKSYLAYHGFVRHGFLPLSLAMPFKAEAVAKLGLPIEEVLGNIPKSEPVRHQLQQMGTEQGRMVYGDDLWTNMMTVWIRWFYDHGVTNFVCSDIRFPNEAAWVRALGGRLIRVEGRGGAETPQARMHISETALDGWRDWDAVIDNSIHNETKASLEMMRLASQWKI